MIHTGIRPDTVYRSSEFVSVIPDLFITCLYYYISLNSYY